MQILSVTSTACPCHTYSGTVQCQLTMTSHLIPWSVNTSLVAMHPSKKAAMTIFRDKHQMSCLMSKILLLTTIRFYLTPRMQLKGYDDNVSGMPASSKDIKIFPKLKCLRIDWIIFLEDIRDQLSEFLEIRWGFGSRVLLLSLTRCSIPRMTEGKETFDKFKKRLEIRLTKMCGFVIQ